MAFDPNTQMRLRFGGIIRVPLFETPYTVPPELGGDHTFDPFSCEPIIQTFYNGVHRAMLPQPQDYGFNQYDAPDAPGYVPYHGSFTYTISDYANPLAVSPSDLYGVNWNLGNLYNVGWRSGITWKRKPNAVRTTWLLGGTPNSDEPDNENYPATESGPTFTCWPSWATFSNYEANYKKYGGISRTGPLPTQVRTLATQQPNGHVVPEGVFSFLHHGRQPKLAAFVTMEADAASGIVTEYGAMFDRIGVFAKENLGGADEFFLFTGYYFHPLGFWLQGASLFMNTRGVMVGPNPDRGPSFQGYEATPSCPKGMILQNQAGNFIALGYGLGTVTLDDEFPAYPYPLEMVPEDGDPLAGYLRWADVTCGWRHSAVLPVSLFPGQAYTPVVLDPSNGVYYTVQIIPKTSLAAQAISSGGPLNRWEWKHSGAGYFMLLVNGPIGQQLFHTSGTSLDYDPQHLSPIAVNLPCFNPCVPNLVIGD